MRASDLLNHVAAIPPRRVSIVFLVTYMAVGAGLAYQVGQDINWDLRNYHFYGAYLALNGRIDTDVHAAGVQTFLNPVLNLPLLFAVRAEVPPVVFGVTIAAFQGLALWCVHRIAVSIVRPATSLWFAHMAGLLAASTAAFGAAFYGELGTTLGDSLIATLVLMALALLLERTANPVVFPRACAIAGTLLGLAAGAKQVGGMYGLGLLFIVWMAAASRRQRALCILAFLLSAAAGLVVTGGYWMWLMQDRFGNPVFPFYNLVFRSEWAPLRDFATDVFAPLPARQMPFSLPFVFLREQLVSAEVPFRDGRFAVGAIGTLTLAAILLAQGKAKTAADVDIGWKRLVMTVVFCAISYIVWSRTMPLYRFAMPLELISPVIALGLIAHTVKHRGRQFVAATAICSALVLWTKPLDFGRLPWKTDYFGVSMSDFADFQGATIVLADFPTGYVVPFFPESATFVRVASNWGLELGSRMGHRAQMRLHLTPRDRLFMLARANASEAGGTVAALDSLGFVVDTSACRVFDAHVDRLSVCQVARRAYDGAAVR